MPQWIIDAWAFILNENYRDALALVGGAVAAVCGGLWAILRRRDTPAPTDPGGDVYADRGGVAAGRDVTIHHGFSSGRAALLAVAVAAAVVAGVALLGPRVTAEGGSLAIGGDVGGSTIKVGD